MVVASSIECQGCLPPQVSWLFASSIEQGGPPPQVIVSMTRIFSGNITKCALVTSAILCIYIWFVGGVAQRSKINAFFFCFVFALTVVLR